MNLNPIQIILGVLLALVVSVASFKARALSRSGALAAAVLGTVIFGLGGLPWAVLLIGFFVSSSALSRFLGKKKAALNEKFSKGSQRDAGQVLANGGVAGLFVFCHLFFPDALWPWLGFSASLASANADTWATELGVLSIQTPVMITTGKKVERGTSGAITRMGTASALAGAAFIAVLSVLPGIGVFQNISQAIVSFLVVTLSGLAGSLIDSFLGATIQAIYFCPACKKETERHPLHTCGSTTDLLRGSSWMDNDWVNTFCTLSGAVIAVLVSVVLG